MNSAGAKVQKINSGRTILSRPEFWFFIVALAGVLLRWEYFREFSHLEHFPCAIGADVMEYDIRAREICYGKIFPAEPEIHAPLYSFFLAFLYRLTDYSIPAVRAVQLLLNWVAYLAFYLLLCKMSVPVKVRLSFLIFAMCTPFTVFHQAELISETLLPPLLAGVFWLLYYARKSRKPLFAAAAGAVTGLCILTHGLMWRFLAAETIWFCWRRKWRTAMLVAGCTLAVVLCVIAVKSAYYGKITSVQGNSVFNLWLGHSAGANGGCWLRPGKAWKDHHRITGETAEQKGVSREWIYLSEIFKFYSDRPLEFFRLTAKKIWLLVVPRETVSGADPPRLIYRTALQYYGRWMSGLVSFFALYGVYIICIKKRRNNFVDFSLLLAGLSVLLVLTVVSGRYRQGMMPGVFLFAAAGCCVFPWKKLWMMPLAAVIYAVVGNFGGGNLPEAASIIGEARLMRNDLDGAEELLRYAGRWIDDPGRFDNALGIIAERRGNDAEAEKCYRRAVEGAPYEPVGYLNLGKFYFDMPGKRSEAVRLITRSLELNENQADAWNFLGIAAFQAREPEAAAECFQKAVLLEPHHQGYKKNLNISLELAESEKKK